jgi:hypothetical protein
MVVVVVVVDVWIADRRHRVIRVRTICHDWLVWFGLVWFGLVWFELN